MLLKKILLLFPLAVSLFFLISLLAASRNFDDRVNQLVLSSIGDAEKLNPILSTDSASSDINGFVFNGLVKYNPDQVLIGDLAERWDVEQSSVFYLQPGLEAEPAAKKLIRELDQEVLNRLKIRYIRALTPHAVEIFRQEAGTSYETEILRLIQPENIVPVNVIFVNLNLEGVFPGGTKVNSANFRQRFEENLLHSSLPAERVIEYYLESSHQLAIKVVGNEKPFTDSVASLLDSILLSSEAARKTGPGNVEKVERYIFDNTPVITFYLRPNVLWHDGKPFTAEDVLFTYEKIMDEKTNTVRRPMFELVKRVQILDPYKLRVFYKKPFSPSLESWGIGIIPKHLLEDQDINTSPINRNPIGTGAFKFKEWISDEKITVAAFHDYFEGRPWLDQISYRIIPEPPISELEFMVGGIDLEAPQPFQYERLAHDRKFEVFKRLANSYTYIGWNNRLPLFKDRKVRMALTHAINRQQIVKYLLYDLGVLATGPFPPQMWYSNPHVAPIPYDPQRARELLAEAGWKDSDGDGVLDKEGKPFRFVLMTNNGNVLRQNIAVLVQRQLKEVGIVVEVELYEWSVFIRDKINARNFEATVLGWSLGLDPDIYEIWHSSQKDKGFNFIGYENPEVDRLIEQGRSEYDVEKRKKIYFRIHELIHQDQPYTFLYVPESTPAMHRNEFAIKRVDESGKVSLEEIKMTEIGLTYFINKWIRAGGKVITKN